MAFGRSFLALNALASPKLSVPDNPALPSSVFTPQTERRLPDPVQSPRALPHHSSHSGSDESKGEVKGKSFEKKLFEAAKRYTLIPNLLAPQIPKVSLSNRG